MELQGHQAGPLAGRPLPGHQMAPLPDHRAALARQPAALARQPLAWQLPAELRSAHGVLRAADQGTRRDPRSATA